MSWTATVHHQVGKVCRRGPGARQQGRVGGGQQVRAHRGEWEHVGGGGDWCEGEGQLLQRRPQLAWRGHPLRRRLVGGG